MFPCNAHTIIILANINYALFTSTSKFIFFLKKIPYHIESLDACMEY